MGIHINLDIERCYPVSNKKTRSSFGFKALLVSGTSELMWIHIDGMAHRHLPGVYNMAYGLEGDDERVNDGTAVRLADASMAFSTILKVALAFLQEKPDAFLGVTGRDYKRLLFFHRVIRSNFDYLSQYFTIIGVKFYPRLLQIKSRQEEQEEYVVDMTDLRTTETRLKKSEFADADVMYNYFIFKLKS